MRNVSCSAVSCFTLGLFTLGLIHSERALATPSATTPNSTSAGQVQPIRTYAQLMKLPQYRSFHHDEQRAYAPHMNRYIHNVAVGALGVGIGVGFLAAGATGIASGAWVLGAMGIGWGGMFLNVAQQYLRRNDISRRVARVTTVAEAADRKVVFDRDFLRQMSHNATALQTLVQQRKESARNPLNQLYVPINARFISDSLADSATRLNNLLGR